MSQRQTQEFIERLSNIELAIRRLENSLSSMNNSLSVTNTIVPTLDTIEQLVKTIKYTIDYDLFPLVKSNRPQKMEIDKPIIEEINWLVEFNRLKQELNDHLDTRLREFSNQLSLQLDLEPFRNNMVKIIVDVAKTHKLIEQGGRLLLDLFSNISPTLQGLGNNSYAMQQQIQQLLNKPALVLDPIITQLQKIDSELHEKIFETLIEEIQKIPKYDTQLDTLAKDVGTLKFIQRDTIDQSFTHQKLQEIIRLVSLLNVDDINLQLSKITIPSPINYQPQLARIEKELMVYNPTIKLDKIQNDLKTLLAKPPVTIPSTGYLGQVSHVEHSTATYLIYSDEKSPDRSHFLL